MLRHLERTSTGISEALDLDLAKREDLACMQPYLPSLSVTETLYYIIIFYIIVIALLLLAVTLL